MPVAFNEASLAQRTIADGIRRQQILTPERVKTTSVLVDRYTLAAEASVQFKVSAKSLAWLYMLSGEATFDNTIFEDRISENCCVLLPPGLTATLSTSEGASLLYTDVPDATRLDSNFSSKPLAVLVLNWTREPVLKAEGDGRKRVALVTPAICNTAAIGIQMVIYPPGATASSYHHEGAESFVYILGGHGHCWAAGQRFSLRQGDFVYFADREPHHLEAAHDSEMRFLVFYVPGEFKTIWADPGKVTAWTSTNRDINGYRTAEDERARRGRHSGISGVRF